MSADDETPTLNVHTAPAHWASCTCGWTSELTADPHLAQIDASNHYTEAHYRPRKAL